MKPPVFLFEDHCESYVKWKEAGMNTLTVVHADAHLDLRNEGFSKETLENIARAKTAEELEPFRRNNDLLWDGFNIGNYLYPAAKDGTVKKLIWVVPPHIVGEQDLLPWTLAELQNWKDVTLDEYKSMKLVDNAVKGTLAGIDLEVCYVEDLKVEDENTVWDIDVDYFFDDDDLAWMSPVDFLEELKEKTPTPEMITIAYSVAGGYTNPRQKYLGDMTKAALAKADTTQYQKAYEAFLQGDLAMKKDRLDEALEYYKKVEDIEPLKPYLDLRMMEIHARKNRPDKAKAILKEIESKRPDLIVPGYDRALILLRQKKYNQALKILNNTVKQGGESFILGHFISSLVHVKQNNYKKAQKHWNAILNSEEYNEMTTGVRSHICFLAGENLNRIGEYEKAVEILNTSIKEFPERPKAYSQRGFSYHQQGNLRKAIRDYKRFLNLSADNVDSINVHELLINAYEKMGRKTMANVERKNLQKKDVIGAFTMKDFLKKRKEKRKQPKPSV